MQQQPKKNALLIGFTKKIFKRKINGKLNDAGIKVTHHWESPQPNRRVPANIELICISTDFNSHSNWAGLRKKIMSNDPDYSVIFLNTRNIEAQLARFGYIGNKTDIDKILKTHVWDVIHTYEGDDFIVMRAMLSLLQYPSFSMSEHVDAVKNALVDQEMKIVVSKVVQTIRNCKKFLGVHTHKGPYENSMVYYYHNYRQMRNRIQALGMPFAPLSFWEGEDISVTEITREDWATHSCHKGRFQPINEGLVAYYNNLWRGIFDSLDKPYQDITPIMMGELPSDYASEEVEVVVIEEETEEQADVQADVEEQSDVQPVSQEGGVQISSSQLNPEPVVEPKDLFRESIESLFAHLPKDVLSITLTKEGRVEIEREIVIVRKEKSEFSL